MRDFQNGEEARVLKRGVEMEVIVFRQSGEFVYVFDKENRLYQFHFSEILPAINPYLGKNKIFQARRPE